DCPPSPLRAAPARLSSFSARNFARRQSARASRQRCSAIRRCTAPRAARRATVSIGAFGLLATVGLLVGAIVGLTGVGGGSIMTPLLITVFGVPAPVAVGTDLACAAVTKAAGSIAHGAARNVATAVVKRLALGSVPAAIATLALVAAAHLEPRQLDRLIRDS